MRHLHAGMNLQEAIDAPAWHSEHFPISFWPRTARPGVLVVEGRLPPATVKELERRGHIVEVDADWCEDVSPPPRARAAAAAPQPIPAACRATPPAGEGSSRLMNAPANSMDESKPGDLLLVTGASGFVGSAISNAARAQGYRVRVLVRPSSPRTNIAPGDEVVVGDIRDRASLVAALRGVRCLAHAAADYRLWSPAPEEIIRTNVDGTRAVMEEALR